MRRLYLVLTLTGLLLLAACGGAGSPDAPLPEAGGATATAPVPGLDAYPSQPTPLPTTLQGDYPAPAEPAPTLEPTAYPADKEIWVLLPFGQQCADPQSYEYENLEAAVQALEQAGVQVLSSETVSKPVCQACDCPTSEHFRAQIRAEDLAMAQEMGWFVE